MLNRFYSWSIRVHLTILIAFLAVPSLSLIIYSGIVERREAINDAKTEVSKFVNNLAGVQEAIVAGAEQLGTTLSLLPIVRLQNTSATSALFADLLERNPQYSNISVCDKDGLIWASAIPLNENVSVAHRRFFQEAVHTGRFSSGEYVIGQILKKGIISFGFPVKNIANKLRGVIEISLDLNYAQQMFEEFKLPPGASFSLLDHQGIMLIRNLNDALSEKLVGKRDTREELFTKMTVGPDEGTYGDIGNDGKFRLVAYHRISLSHESKPYMYVRSSIPLTSATSKATAAIFRNLSVFVSLFLIGLFLAWFIGKYLIINPVMMLKRASQQLAAGADTVNVSHVVKVGELGELALAFDGMAGDLVQRKTALRASEQRWATTLASMGDAVIATDIAGNVTFMNAVAEELTGWILVDAAAKHMSQVFNIINEQNRREVENPVTKVLREGKIVGLANHTVLVRRDGTEVPIDDSAAPIRDSDGKTMGVVLIFRDITERKQAETALHKTRIDMERSQEVGQIGSWQLDITRNVLTWSDENHRIFGVPKGTPMTYESFLAIVHPDDRQYVDAQWNAALAGEPYDIEHRLMVNGQEKWVREKAYLEFDDTGALLGGFGITQDITERKAAEEALQKANTALEERVRERTYELSEAYETLQKEIGERRKTEEHLVRVQKLEALGTLAGGIAHDFNNILAGIIGFTEMVLEDANPDGPEYRRLELVLKGANRGRDLVKQILAFSRQTSPDRKAVRLNQPLEEGLKLLKPVLPSTIEIVSRRLTDDDMVLADPAQIHQILMNLCTNAAHAMRERGGVLNISISDTCLAEGDPAPVPEMRPGEYVVLTVSDTGCGMEPTTLERIFDPFFTTKEQGEGTGLGLSVVHGIIKSHDGYITVESEQGNGSAFYVYLPKIKEQECSEDGGEPLVVTRGKERILFVDDEDMLIELNEQRLNRLGYEVVATTSSMEALAIFRKEPDSFDLVVTDYTMPIMTGVDLAAELLKVKATIPIILCTGHSDTITAKQAQEAGIKAFLMKPLSKQDLAQTIRRVLDKKM